MAIVKPIDILTSLRGKVCMHSDTSFRTRGKTICTQKICNPSTKEPSAAQMTVRERFKTVQAATTTALNDAEKKAAYAATWKKEKYYTLRDWIWHEEWKKATTAEP